MGWPAAARLTRFGVPLAILVMCPAAGVITLLLRAPLTAILLVSLLTGAGATPSMLGLISVSVATALLVGMFMQKRRAGRNLQTPPAESSRTAAGEHSAG